MKKQDEWSFSLMDKLAGELNENKIKELEQEMAQDEEKQAEFDFFSATWEDMKQLDSEIETPTSLSENFYAKLNEIQSKEQSATYKIMQKMQQFYRSVAFKGVAAVLILILGFGGLFLSKQTFSTNEQSYTPEIINYPTNTQKIRAIQAIQKLKTPEDAVRELKAIVQQDANVNVRLAALHKLNVDYSDISMNNFLENQLKTEQSPMVQVELLNMMIEQSKTKESVRKLENMLRKQQLNPLVQEKIQKDLPVLRASFSK